MAIGMAASTATTPPHASAGMPNWPHRLVMEKARQKKKNAKATSIFLPSFLARMLTGA